MDSLKVNKLFRNLISFCVTILLQNFSRRRFEQRKKIFVLFLWTGFEREQKNSSTPDLTQNQFEKKNSSNAWTKKGSAMQKKYFYSLRAVWGLLVNIKIEQEILFTLCYNSYKLISFLNRQANKLLLKVCVHKPNKFKTNFNYKPFFHWLALGYLWIWTHVVTEAPVKSLFGGLALYLSLVSSVKDYWRKIDFSWMVKYQCEQDSKEQPGSAEMLGAPRYSQ